MFKKMIGCVFLVVGFLSFSFTAHAGINQALIASEEDYFFDVVWLYDYNGDDVNVQTGSIWQGSLWIDDNGSTYDVTWGFGRYGESLFISDPITMAKTGGSFVIDQTGFMDIDGFYYQGELDASPMTGGQILHYWSPKRALSCRNQLAQLFL